MPVGDRRGGWEEDVSLHVRLCVLVCVVGCVFIKVFEATETGFSYLLCSRLFSVGLLGQCCP